MQNFNIQYTDEASLIEFINVNSIVQYQSILVQVFSGIIDESHSLKLSQLIKTQLPNAEIIGSSTSGEILHGVVYKDTITISFSLFDKTIVKSKLYQIDTLFDVEKIRKDLILDNTKLLIIFSDGLKSNAEKILKEIYRVKPEMVIAGGRAGDNAIFERTYVFNEESYSDNGCVIATLSSDTLIVNSDYILNWTPIGKDMVVTKVDQNILYELDGIPILDVYRKYLGSEVVSNLPSSAMEFPLIVKRNELNIARDPLSVTKDNALVYAGNFEEGDNVRFSFGNIDDISIDNINYFKLFSKFPAESIFAYSCTARKALMGKKLNNELNILESLAPTVGFFTYGEYFHSSNIVEILNVTTTFVILSESSKLQNKSLNKTPEQEYDPVKKALTHLVKVTNEELQHISTHDILTSLYNRVEYIKKMELKIKSAQRYNEHFALMLIDIDFFKLINDNYGHNIGDEILKSFAKVLLDNTREDDFVARWGGEEFVVILNYATLKDVEKLTKKIQKKINATSFSSVPKLTASFGLTVYIDGDNEESIFKRVDNALYTAKQSGRDTYIFG